MNDKIKAFAHADLVSAYAHAKAGGQALHLVNHSGGIYQNAPKCFQRAKEFGHLFDQNRQRLESTARRLGVRIIKVSHSGTHRQHIDLCGAPLAKAKSEAGISDDGDGNG